MVTDLGRKWGTYGFARGAPGVAQDQGLMVGVKSVARSYIQGFAEMLGERWGLVGESPEAPSA